MPPVRGGARPCCLDLQRGAFAKEDGEAVVDAERRAAWRGPRHE